MKPLAFLCFLLLCCAVLSAADPVLTKEERAKAIQLLRDSQKEFLAAVENQTDAQWNYKPAPDRWSVAEVAEHITLSEGFLFNAMQKTLSGKPNPDWEAKTAGKDEVLERLLLNRERKAQAPEPLKPQHKWSRVELLNQYKEARAKTLKFAEETTLPMKEYTVDFPSSPFGTLNGYHNLIFIPLHNMRHNKQIAEVKSDPGFPK